MSNLLQQSNPVQGRLLNQRPKPMIKDALPASLNEKRKKKQKKLAGKAKRAKPGKQARITTTQKAFDCKMGLWWSKWYEILAPRRGCYVHDVFKRGRDLPAVYEIGVQPAKGAKKQIVYCCSSERYPYKRTVVSYFLRRAKIDKQINNVLAQECCVFIRRCELPRPVRCCMQRVKTAAELKRLILKHYDYAWNKAVSKLTDVTINGITYCKAVDGDVGDSYI